MYLCCSCKSRMTLAREGNACYACDEGSVLVNVMNAETSETISPFAPGCSTLLARLSGASKKLEPG